MAVMNDSWITTRVKSDLVTEQGIPGMDITVETDSGVVSLSSAQVLTAAQKGLAVTITGKVKGVRSVSADGLRSE